MLTRSTAIVGSLLTLFGLAVFAWKTVALELPVVPSRPEGVWRVELQITPRGSGRRGSVRAALPSSGPGQVIFDETSSADRLAFSIRSTAGQRTGIWTGRLTGSHEIVYGFRVDLSAVEIPLPTEPAAPSAEMMKDWGTATAEFPARAPEIAELLERLDLPGPADPLGRLRAIFAFVTDEVGTVSTGSDDALLTLTTREGRAEGKIRLLVATLRAAGIPARPTVGLRLREGEPSREDWAEAWVGGRWVPLSPLDGTLGRKPEDVVLLRAGSLAAIDATGVEAMAYRYRALREHLRPDEIATMMVPTHPVLARLSPYRLPIDTQSALRRLLLLPLGALVIALFRNVVGVPTYGTFMPVLIALALRFTSLGPGLAMIAGVLLIGILGRLGLDRLRLLLVPRLAVLLCIVVLVVTGLALMGRTVENRDFATGVLFPMVILTMLIERFSITLAEEGARTALGQAGTSTLVAVAVYPIFRSSFAEHLMFGFPELVITIMGLLVLIGGYTGYRLVDLIRFRSLAQSVDGGAP